MNWAVLPVRKPLAVGAAFFVAIVVYWHTLAGTDIPPGTADVMKTLIYVCVGGYAATSAYETTKGPYHKENKENEE